MCINPKRYLMKKLVILSIAIIALFACKEKQRGRTSASEDSSAQVSTVVAGIAGTNVLMGPAVGIAGSRPEQWDRFEILQAKATNEELFALTSDTNAVVRCYAFQALADKNHVNVFPVMLRHLSDTVSVHTLYGCLGGSEKVGDFMLNKIYPGDGDGGSMGFRLSRTQRAIIDSLLLYVPDNRLDKRDMVISRLDPLARYYPRIRQLATTEKSAAAIEALAKYKKQQDIIFIEELLKDSNSQQLGFAAVKNFPDRSFYPYLEKALKDRIKNNKDSHVQELYYAIVQYKDKTSKQLLEFALRETKDMQYLRHSDFLSQALREYPAKIYEGVVKPVYTGRPLR